MKLTGKPFEISDFSAANGITAVKERAVELHLALGELEVQAGSAGANPQIIFYGNTEYERLWTAHGLFFLQPLLGRWYWVNEPVALTTLVERWPRYRDYFLERTRWAIEHCAKEHDWSVDHRRESDARFWDSLREQLRRELDDAERADDPLPPEAP